MGEQKIKYVLIVSKTQAKAQMLLQQIKYELETNPLLQKDLGPFQTEGGQWNITSIYLQRYNAKITAVSAEQSIRGSRHMQFRPQLILADDLEDLDSVRTEEGRNKIYQWLLGDVIPAGTKHTRLMIIGSLLHNDSLIRRLQKEMDSGQRSGTYREYPILDEDGNPTWPAKFPNAEAIAAEKKDVGSEVAWQREYMLKVIPEEGQIVKPEMIKYYKTFPSEPALPYKYSLIGIDLAISEKATADFTAMIGFSVYGSKENLRVYVHANPVNERLTFQAMKTKAEMLSQSLGRGSLAKILVEDVGIQSVLPQELVADNFPAEGCKIQGDKRERLSIAAFLVEQGKVFFPNQGAEKLIEQLLGFGDADHDDLCDAFSMVLVEIIKKESGHPFTFFTAEKYFTTGKQEIKPDVKIAKPEEKPQPGITTTIIDTRPPWEKGGKTLEELGHEEDLKILEDERKKAEGPGDDGERKIKPSWF